MKYGGRGKSKIRRAFLSAETLRSGGNNASYKRKAKRAFRQDGPGNRVYDLLDELNISYEYVDHEPMRSMQDCLEVDSILNAAICKNLFLCNHQKTAYYLLMLPGEKKFRSGEVSRLAGSSRLSFAPPEDMERLLDLSPGSVSVMGLMNDHEGRVQLLMDEEILTQEYFGCHPCVNTTSLRLSVRDLTEKILKKIRHEPMLLHLS